MKQFIDILKSKRHLTASQAKEILIQILKGYFVDEDIYHFLSALNQSYDVLRILVVC